MPNSSDIPKWVLAVFAFLLGSLGTGVTMHFSMARELSETTSRSENNEADIADWKILTGDLVEVTRDLVAELRAERAVRDRNP